MDVATIRVHDTEVLSLACPRIDLDGRARALLRSTGVTDHVRIVEWWTDAVDAVSRAA